MTVNEFRTAMELRPIPRLEMQINSVDDFARSPLIMASNLAPGTEVYLYTKVTGGDVEAQIDVYLVRIQEQEAELARLRCANERLQAENDGLRATLAIPKPRVRRMLEGTGI